MRPLVLRVAAALALGACPFAALAQAPAAAPSSTPAAPTPARLADGRPNWTGFWVPRNGLFDRKLGEGYTAPASAAPPSRAPHDILRLMKSPYRERYAELLRKEAEGEPAYDPAAVCFPPGMPRVMNMTYGMEILQAHGVLAITSEWGPATRRIWVDGRSLPPMDDLEPTFSGYSVGRWEGDVLIVETVALRTDAVMNQSGLMHSDKLRLVERFQQAGPGDLIDEIMVIDPEVFTEPWKMTRRYVYRPDLSLQEYVCEDNNRNMGTDGKPTFGRSK